MSDQLPVPGEDIAKLLIHKVSKAVGTLYEPIHTVVMAHAEARADRIRTLASIQNDELKQRALHRLAHEEARKQENIEAITSEAATALSPGATPDKMNDDWVAHFYDRAKLISDEQMRSIWANLLAGEASAPGHFSKRTIDVIAALDKSDAELFTRLSSFIWFITRPVLLVFDTKSSIYTDLDITFDSLTHLESIGLVRFDSVAGFRLQGLKQEFSTWYYGSTIRFDTKIGEIPIGKALLTRAGLELSSLCNGSEREGFVDYALKQFTAGENNVVHSPFPRVKAGNGIAPPSFLLEGK